MFTSKTLQNLNEKLIQKKKALKTLVNGLDVVRYERDEALLQLAHENDAYQVAIREFDEAKARMNAAHERMKDSARLIKQIASEFGSLVKNKAKVTDEIIDTQLKINTIELEQNLAAVNKEEKQVTKKIKKYITNDLLLRKIQIMPQDVMLLIRGYLPYDVRVSLIKDSFNSVMDKCSGPEPAYLFVSFLNYAATCPEFLPLLSRKEARHQIPSLTPRGFHWRAYTYCTCRKTGTPVTKLVKNKINWLIELAQASNPKFAYKVMKTVVVFGSDFSRIKSMPYSGTERAKRYLTLQDLPANYR
jgi:hypothetical protein